MKIFPKGFQRTPRWLRIIGMPRFRKRVYSVNIWSNTYDWEYTDGTYRHLRVMEIHEIKENIICFNLRLTPEEW